MQEIVEVESPVVQLRCTCCGNLSDKIVIAGEVELEKYLVPILAQPQFRFRGIEVRPGAILPGVCPSCSREEEE